MKLYQYLWVFLCWQLSIIYERNGNDHKLKTISKEIKKPRIQLHMISRYSQTAVKVFEILTSGPITMSGRRVDQQPCADGNHGLLKPVPVLRSSFLLLLYQGRHTKHTDHTDSHLFSILHYFYLSSENRIFRKTHANAAQQKMKRCKASASDNKSAALLSPRSYQLERAAINAAIRRMAALSGSVEMGVLRSKEWAFNVSRIATTAGV